MIRKLRPTDQDAYHCLKLDSFHYKSNYQITAEDCERSFVWEENGRPAGFCKWMLSGFIFKFAEIGTLMVKPAFRGRGIAKALVQVTMEDALKHVDNIRIYDTSRYGQTSRIAKALGFIEKDTRDWWLK